MNSITARTNPHVQQVIALHDSQERNKQGLFLAEGTRVCSTLVQAGVKLHTLFVTEAQSVKTLPYAPRQLTILVADHVMKKMSQAITPSGILGIFHIPVCSIKPVGPGLVLAQVRDPGNVGTLIRSAAAFGATQVILVESADPWSYKVIQAAAGAHAHIAVSSISWDTLLALNVPLCALTVTDGMPPQELPSSSAFLVVGNEGQGIPAEWLTHCTYRMTIPMIGHTESLNAAIAGSLALYLLTQR